MDRKTNIKAYNTIDKTNKIIPVCSFMVGTPGETPETIQETINAIEETGVVDSAVFFTTPYPGSRLFRWCKEQGLIKDTEKYLYRVSDRDASKLSINLTKYPDIIVKIMKILIQNVLDKNKMKKDKHYSVSFKKRIIKFFLAPVIYNAYFSYRRIMKLIFRKYKKDTVTLNLNSRGTVMLSLDKNNMS